MDSYTERRRANGAAAAAGKADPTLGRAHSGRSRQRSRREWWHPTPFSRFLGAVLVAVAFVALLGLAGWVEGWH